MGRGGGQRKGGGEGGYRQRQRKRMTEGVSWTDRQSGRGGRDKAREWKGGEGEDTKWDKPKTSMSLFTQE